MLSPEWYNTLVRVERQVSTRLNRRESVTWDELYAELRCAIAGTYSKTEPAMVGMMASDEYWLTVRQQDIGEPGWPRENDRVTLDGDVYYVTSVSDQTRNASFFQIPKHKIIKIGKHPVVPIDA